MCLYRNSLKCMSLARSRWQLSEASFASEHQPVSSERPQRRHGAFVCGRDPTPGPYSRPAGFPCHQHP